MCCRKKGVCGQRSKREWGWWWRDRKYFEDTVTFKTKEWKLETMWQQRRILSERDNQTAKTSQAHLAFIYQAVDTTAQIYKPLGVCDHHTISHLHIWLVNDIIVNRVQPLLQSVSLTREDITVSGDPLLSARSSQTACDALWVASLHTPPWVIPPMAVV